MRAAAQARQAAAFPHEFKPAFGVEYTAAEWRK
jgi:hypothetical protein